MGKTIAIIPARGGSKRLPGKNLMLLDGIPLLAHSILYAQSHPQIIDEIYVSTDDDAIAQTAVQYGAKVIARPPELSGDFEPTVTAIEHTLQHIPDADIVVLLQATNPLRPVSLLPEAYGIFQKNNCDSLFTVTRNHHKLGRVQNDRFVPFNYRFGQRSQDLEPLFFENGLLYISTRNLILAQHTIIGEYAYPLEVTHPFGAVDIDTAADFNFATYLLNKQE